MGRVTEFLQRIRPDMVISQDQTIRRYKRTATAAANPNTALLQMLQPSGGRGEMILLLKLFCGCIVKEPQAFVRERRAYKENRRRTENKPWFREEQVHRILKQNSRKRAQGTQKRKEKQRPVADYFVMNLLSFVDPPIDRFANRAAPALEAFGRRIAVQTKSPMAATSSRSIPVSNLSPRNR